MKRRALLGHRNARMIPLQRMIGKIILTVIGALVGGWMLFDGMYVMLRGKYFGPEKPGPWSSLFIRAGVDPFKLGPLFVTFGLLWILFLIAMLCGQAWGRWGAIAVAVASLWYLPVGTVLSIIFLVMLLCFRV
jgi:hypothetical protein